MKRIRRVLLATDLSKTSRHAFSTAVGMAKSLRAPLSIVYVIPPTVNAVPEQYLDAVTLDRLDGQARQWATRQLRQLVGRAKGAGVNAKALVLRGDPVGQIVRSARAQHAGLIVVGTHGRHGLPKFFLGSVAERVVTTAPCPVLTARGTA